MLGGGDGGQGVGRDLVACLRLAKHTSEETR